MSVEIALPRRGVFTVGTLVGLLTRVYVSNMLIQVIASHHLQFTDTACSYKTVTNSAHMFRNTFNITQVGKDSRGDESDKRGVTFSQMGHCVFLGLTRLLPLSLGMVLLSTTGSLDILLTVIVKSSRMVLAACMSQQSIHPIL